ncbi:MAG: DNA adenine methylase, partial [Candidatus Omnitrophica bacterium]|nr:DNA adenine methylase [Candidatus Omnitrophota bacterium]
MTRRLIEQPTFFPDTLARFPSTRYQGSKAKLADWILEQIAPLNFETGLDAFGGTGAIAYRLKHAGKTVTYNDILKFNHYFGLALIENNNTRLNHERLKQLLTRHHNITYPSFVQNTFHDIYFTDEENAWIDQTITNIFQFADPYEIALAFFALCQSCIVKRPYNLFHRKNLYLRFAEVERSFGNKTTWDASFEEWFRIFVGEANQAVFDNGCQNRAINCSTFDVQEDYDLVYIDTPYISSQGVGVDYYAFYHFLEGLTMYDEWSKHIDYESKHRRLKPRSSEWTDKRRIHAAFDQLFARFRESILVVSYRSDGFPSETELISLLKKYKRHVRVEYFGRYKYVLSKNCDSKEILLI